MMHVLLIFATSFLFVGLRAFQQLNVQHSRFSWVMPTSMMMALCEVTIIAAIVREGISAAFPLGAGAGLGCIAAMLLHQRMRRGRDHKDMGH